MREHLSLAIIVPLLLSAAAHGQDMGPSRPPLSPYLNQLRGGNPAVNYFFGVAGHTQRQAVQLGRPQAGPDVKPVAFSQPVAAQPVDPGTTGHTVQFMNCSPYFNLGGPLATPGNVRRSARR